VDSSSVIFTDLDALDSAIVICLSHPVWAQTWFMAMLALLASSDHHEVAYMPLMWDSLSVFKLVVLSDKLLLQLFDELPIGFE